MKSPEDAFLATKEILRAQAVAAIDEALDRVYVDYLPHVTTDTQSNVYFQTCDWLRKFFADSLDDDDIKVSMAAQGWDCWRARQKIYEANKTEIIEALGKDFEAEVASLKEQLNTAYRRY